MRRWPYKGTQSIPVSGEKGEHTKRGEMVWQFGGVRGGLSSLSVKKRMDFTGIDIIVATPNSLTPIVNED